MTGWAVPRRWQRLAHWRTAGAGPLPVPSALPAQPHTGAWEFSHVAVAEERVNVWQRSQKMSLEKAGLRSTTHRPRCPARIDHWLDADELESAQAPYTQSYLPYSVYSHCEYSELQ